MVDSTKYVGISRGKKVTPDSKLGKSVYNFYGALTQRNWYGHLYFLCFLLDKEGQDED